MTDIPKPFAWHCTWFDSRSGGTLVEWDQFEDGCEDPHDQHWDGRKPDEIKTLFTAEQVVELMDAAKRYGVLDGICPERGPDGEDPVDVFQSVYCKRGAT